MALWFDLKVNHATIGRMVIVRESPAGLPDDGQVCRYRWDILGNDPDDVTAVPMQHGVIDYPYGDALGLVGAVIAKAKPLPPPPRGAHTHHDRRP